MSDIGFVVVVDDDESLCALIENTLKQAGLRVRTFTSAEAFIAADVRSEVGDSPCCLLMDLVMPGLSGLDILEKHYPEKMGCSVIMMTARGTVDAAVKSMKLGAVDFLEKPFSPETLKTLVLDTLKKSKNSSATASKREALRAKLTLLSPRERELLSAIVAGSSTKMIADALQISSRTVDHHRANLMEKMKANNVADLVRMAVEGDYKTIEASGH